MSESKVIGGSRFIRGDQPGGFAAMINLDDEGRIIATITADTSKEGPPGHVHGGALATMLDEVMGVAAWTSGHKVLAANLNINYRLPVPLHTELTVIGWVEDKDGRKITTRGQLLLPDGRIGTEGTGLFIEAPDIFGEHDYSVDV